MLADRVKDTSTTTGTGNFVLSGSAPVGFQALAAIGAVGSTFGYVIDGGAEWECGIGTITATNTFSRAPSASSNGGALVSFSVGTKSVFHTVTAAQHGKYDQATSARVYYLTKMGAIDDADVSAASTTFGTDSTAAIQAALNLASATNPIKVVVDGRFSTTGLRVKGNTHIDALPGCGMILRTGSNKSLLENYNLSFDPAARTDKNITITGGIWNGNRGVASANNSKGNGTIGLNCIMRFYGVENLDLSPSLLVNSPSYSMHKMNCKHVRESFVKHTIGASPVTNNDGTNTGGWCEDIAYRDLVISAGDDPISISPDDVWRYGSGFTYPYYPLAANGAIKNVLVDNVLLDDSQVYGVRLMSGVSRLDNVTIRNLSGTTTLWALLLDNRQAEGDLTGVAGNGNIGTVTIDGMDVALSSGTSVIRIRSSAEKIVIKRLRRNAGTGNVPTIQIDGTGVTIQSLIIDGYESYDTGTAWNTPHINIIGGTIRELKITNVTARRPSASNGSQFLKLSGGAIVETLQANTVLLDGFDNLLKNLAGTVTRIQASNVVHLNANGGATFDTASTIARLGLSGYIGVLATTGTFSTMTGDGFAADTTRPTALSAAVTNAVPTRVRVTVSEPLDTGNVPAASAFTVGGHTVSAVAVSSLYFDLTVNAFTAGEAARTVDYVKPGTGAITDIAQNQMNSFTALAIASTVGQSYVTLAGNGALVDDGTTKSLTNTAPTDGQYHSYLGAAGTAQLASDGFVSMRYLGASQAEQIIGFNTANSVAVLANAGIGFLANGAVNFINNAGGDSGNRPSAIVGNYYRVRRVGSVFTAETSSDALTWTSIYTFALATSATVYVIADLYGTGSIPNMSSGGLT